MSSYKIPAGKQLRVAISKRLRKHNSLNASLAETWCDAYKFYIQTACS